MGNKIPFGYFRIARILKSKWEENLAAGAESRSFGKTMMDRCQQWAAQLKSEPNRREEFLVTLMKECEYRQTEFDALPLSEVPEEVDAHADYDAERLVKADACRSKGIVDIPDEF